MWIRFKSAGIRLMLIVSVICVASIFAAPAQAVTQSPIDQRYNSTPALQKLLGPPISGEYSIAGGSARNYKWGNLYYSQATGVREVHGAILWKFKQVGGPAQYGFPTTDETKVNGSAVAVGAVSKFQKGAIGWSSKYGPHLMAVSVANFWSLPYRADALGAPIADQTAVARSGYKVQFEKADVYWSSATGVFPVYKVHEDSGAVKIREKYVALGSSASVVGLPTSDFLTIHDDSSIPDGATQKFQYGEILLDYISNSAVAPHEVHGPIYQRFKAEGYVASLGFPTSDVKPTADGAIATFDKGTISWNATTGKTTVKRY